MELSSPSQNLPCDILIDILARVSLKTLINCRLVCKSWKSLISDLYFFKLYNDYMPTCLILQLEGNTFKNFNKTSFIDKNVDSYILRSTSLLSDVDNPNSNYNNSGLIPPDFRFKLGNSCNGFICLTKIQNCNQNLIWNPILRQFVILPKPTTATTDRNVIMGLGYCNRTDRYKVIRIFRKLDHRHNKQAEIYELGVGLQWREIGDVPFNIPTSNRGFFFNNSIHWLLLECNNNTNNKNNKIDNFDLIGGFDFVQEKFITISPPPIFKSNKLNEYYWSNLGVIGNRFSICATDAVKFRPDIQVWVMEQYGISDSWSIRYSIRDPFKDWCNPYKWIQFINYLKSRKIYMMCSHDYVVAYNAIDREYVGYIKELTFDSIAHVPSLISLKEILNQRNGTGSLEVRYM